MADAAAVHDALRGIAGQADGDMSERERVADRREATGWRGGNGVTRERAGAFGACCTQGD